MKKLSKKTKKILIIILTILLSIFIINEIKNIYIDNYNFKQLEKVKSVLDKLPEDEYSFKGLKEFNKNFNQDIQPIKNCYFIRNRIFEGDKGSGGYIFGFKLYSITYKLKYGTELYTYPKYDLPVMRICNGGLGGKAGCSDGNFDMFETTISNPCRNRD